MKFVHASPCLGKERLLYVIKHGQRIIVHAWYF